MRSAVPGDVEGRPADPAPDVQDPHAGPEPRVVGEPLLLFREGLGQTLRAVEGRQVEGGGPVVAYADVAKE
ncbi:hypothetical protein [Streptomyces sp. NBC_01362]|uniref:hypothetical protein n=1 Tax=Streptomyces sp. NBC_01362 TaxID=2903839 RepID=UPI002E315B9F|nr:hypothetical protein [Streptomyces sp. NBC_01362]